MKKTYRLEGLDCANCAAKMERAISKIKGVSSVSINFMTTKMTMDFDEGRAEEILSEALKAVKKFESHVNIKEA